MSVLSSAMRWGLGGVAAIGLTFSAANAASISAVIVPDPTSANMPFTLENFGTSGGAGRLGTASPVNLSTGVVVTFGAGANDSGMYVGDVSGVTRSPFRDAGGAATTDVYLNARAGGGSIVLDYTGIGLQTAFNLLWGSVDNNPVDYNKLVFTFSGGGGSEVITGVDIIAAAGGAPPVVVGTTNVAVNITGLIAFDTITVTATAQAFEFVPGTPVPEPGTLLLVGAGLLGLGLVRRKAT